MKMLIAALTGLLIAAPLTAQERPPAAARTRPAAGRTPPPTTQSRSAIAEVPPAAAPAYGTTTADVILNEILANPLDEDTGEFVELFNAGDEPVDLSGWRLADAADTNDLIEDYTGPHDWGLGGTVIPPGGYALVVDPEYAGDYAAFLEAHADPDGTVLLTIGKDTTIGNGLTNAGDLVRLGRQGTWLAVFGWPSDPGQGVSWEKIEPGAGDGPENWAPCAHPHGSTPGRRNSLAPAEYDVGIPAAGLTFSPPAPSPGRPVVIAAAVENRGKRPAAGVEMRFFHDSNRDSLLVFEEQIGDVHPVEEPLEPGRTAVVEGSWIPAASGPHLMAVEASFGGDQDPADNTAFAILQVRYLSGSVVINEIMYHPAPTGEESEREPEWLEILHLAEDPINLAGWTVEDSRGQPEALCDSSAALAPGDYVIVAAADPEAFAAAYPQTAGTVLFPPGGLPSLNNSEDLLLLRDPAGTTVDSVLYSGTWGGGSGISLERVNPHLGSNDPLNWGWCVHRAGSTPGTANSIFTPVIPGRTELTVSPNPFSPDGDGRQEVTVISYRLPTPAAFLRLFLFDVRGRRVRTLADGRRSGSQGDLLWDGKNDDGEVLKMGIYIIYLEALDDRRGVVCRRKGTVVLAGRLD
jgi:hypothetical protein